MRWLAMILVMVRALALGDDLLCLPALSVALGIFQNGTMTRWL